MSVIKEGRSRSVDLILETMPLLLASLPASRFAISKTQRFTIEKASDRHLGIQCQQHGRLGLHEFVLGDALESLRQRRKIVFPALWMA